MLVLSYTQNSRQFGVSQVSQPQYYMESMKLYDSVVWSNFCSIISHCINTHNICIAKIDLCALQLVEFFFVSLVQNILFNASIRFYTKFPTIWCITSISVVISNEIYEIILFHGVWYTIFGPVGWPIFGQRLIFVLIIITGTETNSLIKLYWKSDK